MFPNTLHFSLSACRVTSKFTALFFSICLVLLALASVAEAVAQDLKIGVVVDQSSFNADIARDYLAGARTYFDYINGQGGINGRRLSLIVKDDEGDAAKTVLATRQLVDEDKVDALFGYVGDDGVAAVATESAFKRARIALYAPLSGVEVSKTPDTIFFVRPTYREEARHLISHFTLLGNKRFVVLASASTFGERLSKQISEKLAARNLTLSTTLVIPVDLKNLEQLAKRTLVLDPQVVVVAADTISMAEFLRKFRALDKGTNIVGFSIVNHRTLMELAKPEFAAGTMLTQVVPHPELPMTKIQSEHLALFKKYREEPPSHVTLEGFLAAKSFVTSISKGSLTRAGILASLSGSQRIDTGGIVLSFSAANDRGSSFVDLSLLRKSGRLIQ